MVINPLLLHSLMLFHIVMSHVSQPRGRSGRGRQVCCMRRQPQSTRIAALHALRRPRHHAQSQSAAAVGKPRVFFRRLVGPGQHPACSRAARWPCGGLSALRVCGCAGVQSGRGWEVLWCVPDVSVLPADCSWVPPDVLSLDGEVTTAHFLA